MSDRITLDHGDGGAATARLVNDLFLRHLGGPRVLEDAAIVAGGAHLALTTDAFVVRPLVFPGGDIGRLSICGTVNDLAVMGARPHHLTAAFILEEGLEISLLHELVASMAVAAREANVRVVAGDTKVVGRGEADGLFICTAGVGTLPAGRLLSSASCRIGDRVLVSGPVGDHGTAVLAAREGFGIKGDLRSDCQPVVDLAHRLLEAAPRTRCMRDPTRGGLATALAEIAGASCVRLLVRDEHIPVRDAVCAACDLLGLDPLYMACEGRFLAVVPPAEAEAALEALRGAPRGREATLVGEVVEGDPGAVLETAVGGLRPLTALERAQLPRIC